MVSHAKLLLYTGYLKFPCFILEMSEYGEVDADSCKKGLTVSSIQQVE